MPSSSSRPVARCCWASISRSEFIRSYTALDTSGGRSIFLTRTSMTSTPISWLISPCNCCVSSAMSSSRWPEMTSCMSRRLIWLRQALVHPLRQQVPRAVLVPGTGGVVPLDIPDPELDEGVDDQRLLLQCEVALGTGVERQDAAVELLGFFRDRQLEVQTRVQVGAGHRPETQHQGPLALVHGEDAVDQQQDDQDQDDTYQDDPKAHVAYLETVRCRLSR